MLDDNYYKLMLDGRRVADGISVLDAEYLILFKAKAWLDLAKRKEAGEHVNERDLRKHKNDVFRLYAIADPEARIELSEPVANDMDAFLQAMSGEQIVLRDLGITGITVEEIFDSLRVIFALSYMVVTVWQESDTIGYFPERCGGYSASSSSHSSYESC